MLAYQRCAELCKYRPDQPRVPAGNSSGGQWTRDGGGGAAGSDPDVLSDADPENTWEPGAQYAQNDASEPPGIGHNDEPSLEPPEIPERKPRESSDRTAFQKEVARRLGRFPSASLAASALTGLLNNIGWLKDYQASIASYRGPPNSLEELYKGIDDTGPGYESIILSRKHRFDGFSTSEIKDRENLMRVPKLKHYEITGWFSKSNIEYGGLSPREYLRGKNWEERRRIGVEALRRFGGIGAMRRRIKTKFNGKIDVRALSLESLVSVFVELALEQQDAVFWARHKEYNRLFDIVSDVERELDRRQGGRLALIPLLSHESVQVRLNAALGLWDTARQESRTALELIDRRNEMPQAADARGWIWSRQGK